MSRGPHRSCYTSGSALARARIAAGLTQQQLADRAKVSQAAVGFLETGHTIRPHWATAEAITTALGMTVADLWPTLAKAVKRGRLLDTVIPIEKAVRHSRGVRHHGMRLAYSDPEGGTRVRHSHRPPICCGCMFCRIVDLNDPETYRVIAEPVLIAAGGANA